MRLSSSEYVVLVAALFAVTAAGATLVAVLTHFHGRLAESTRRRLFWTVLLAYALAVGVNLESLLLGNTLVLAAAVVGGAKIGSLFSSRSALIAGSVAASVADIVSFTIGPTRWLFEGIDLERWGRINYLMISMPWGHRLVPVMGVGDLLFVAVFYHAMRHLGVPRWLCLAAPLAGLTVALAVGLRLSGAFGIPFMTAAVLLALWYHDRAAARTGLGDV